MIGEIAVPSNYSAFNFIDSGTILDQITLEEFNIFGGKLISAETIGTKNNILFAANTKEISENITLDCRAYRFNPEMGGAVSRIWSNGTDNYSDGDICYIIKANGDFDKNVYSNGMHRYESSGSNFDIPLDFNCIDKYNNEFLKTSGTSEHQYIQDKKSDGVTYGGTGKIVSYEIKVDSIATKLMDNGETIVNKDNIDFILRKTSFKQGETYRFGLTAYDLKGKPYFTEWIGDIRIPYFTGVNNILENTMYGPYVNKLEIRNIDTNAKNIYIDFSINTTNINTYYPGILSKISGFEIVKVQRTSSDKSVVAQGCSIGGVIFNKSLAYNRCLPVIGKYINIGSVIETVTDSSNTIHTFYSPEFNINGGIDVGGNYRLNVVKILTNPMIKSNYKPYYNPTYYEKAGFGDSLSFNAASQIFYPINKFKNDVYNTITSTELQTLPDSATTINVGYSIDIIDIIKTTIVDNNGSQFIISNENYINRVASNSEAIDQTMFGQTGVILSSSSSNKLTKFTTGIDSNENNRTGFTYILDLYIDNSSTRYGGNTYLARTLNEYEKCSNFIVKSTGTQILTANGDSYNTIWDTLTSGADPSIDDSTGGAGGTGVNRRQIVSLLPLESSINCMLTGSKPSKYIFKYYSGPSIGDINNGIDTIGLCETELKGISIYGSKYPKLGDFNAYNTVYSSTSKYPTFFPKPNLFDGATQQPNTIYASEKKLNGEYVDSWSKFLYANTLEVEGVHGAIHKLTTLDNKLYFFQEGAIGVAAVNDRYIIGQGDAAKLSLGTGTVLERYDYVKYNEGIIKPEHVINTITNLYFIDHNRKVIDIIGNSDVALSIEKGVNTLFRQLYKDSTTLVTIGFDPVYREVLFNINNGNPDGNKTLVYNENINQFQPRSSATPQLFLSISDGLLSFKQSNNVINIRNYIYKHNAGKIGELYSESLTIDAVTIIDNGTSEEYIPTLTYDGGASTSAITNELDGGLAPLTNETIPTSYSDSFISILVGSGTAGVFVADDVEFRTEVRDLSDTASIFNDKATFEEDINHKFTGVYGDTLKTVDTIEFQNSYQYKLQTTVVKQDNTITSGFNIPNTSRRNRSWTTKVPFTKDLSTGNNVRFLDTFLSMKFTFTNHDNKVFKLHDVITYIRPTHK